LKASGSDPGRLEQDLEKENTRIMLESIAAAGAEAEALMALTLLEIDCNNILTALRLQRSPRDGTTASVFFLEGGKAVNRTLFEELSTAADESAAIGRLKDLGVGEPFRAALAEHRRSGTLSPFEKEAHRFLTRQARNWSARDALGIGVALGYIWEKSQEVSDLRLLCRAKEVGMPKETLAAELAVNFN
jgi:vacuolar-type H+-ATPase subunit C/Vma6